MRFTRFAAMVGKSTLARYEETSNIWAEAVDRWKVWAEPLYLDTPELIAAATVEQERRVESDDWAPMIEAWLNDATSVEFDGEAAPRDQTTPAQLWTKALGGALDKLSVRESRRINNIMRRMKGWEERTMIPLGGDFGPSRGFARKATTRNRR
jgi:hypothetical protein